jgi:pimeloyl-ACP methyl ester carboxylesterase
MVCEVEQMKANILGHQLRFEVSGQSGVPLVLIHGFGLDRTIWKEMIQTYFEDQFIVLPDTLGHGESEAPQGGYPMTSLAADLAGLLDFVAIPKAIVCGHSMGGYIALAFADQFPDRLAGLGLITTRADADTAEKKAGRYAMIETIKEKGASVQAKALAPRLSYDEEVVRYSMHLLEMANPQGLIGSLQGMAERADRGELLRRIEVPSLVVAGEQDQIVPIEEAKAMADALKGSTFVIIPGGGHMPMMENPKMLSEGLKNLTKRVETQ